MYVLASLGIWGRTPWCRLAAIGDLALCTSAAVFLAWFIANVCQTGILSVLAADGFDLAALPKEAALSMEAAVGLREEEGRRTRSPHGRPWPSRAALACVAA